MPMEDLAAIAAQLRSDLLERNRRDVQAANELQTKILSKDPSGLISIDIYGQQISVPPRLLASIVEARIGVLHVERRSLEQQAKVGGPHVIKPEFVESLIGAHVSMLELDAEAVKLLARCDEPLSPAAAAQLSEDIKDRLASFGRLR